MKRKIIWLGLSVLMVAAMLLASCGTTTTTPTTTTTTTTTSTVAAGPTVLTVSKGNQVKTYSLADLQALPSVSGNGGSKGKGGTITGPYTYQGVALMDLLNAVGGISQGQSVTLTSSDNYTTTLTYDVITNNSFNFYDTTGNPITPQTKPTLAMVYSQNGTALDSTHGPVELGFISAQSILTDGSMWAKMVVNISIASTAATTTTASTTAAVTTTTTSTTVTTTTTTTAAVVITTTPVATTPVILTVVNGGTSKTFSMAQLQQITPTFAQSGFVKGGAVGSIDQYVGVALKDLLAVVGGFTASNSVTVADPTGYSKTFTYAMIVNGTGFTVLDNTGATVSSPQPVVPFLAYTKNGAALDTTNGPLYLGFISNVALNQYTQSSLWIKNVVTITIIAAQ